MFKQPSRERRLGFDVLDTFGAFDSIKSPTQTELKLDEISDQLEALEQCIANGVFDIIDTGSSGDGDNVVLEGNLSDWGFYLIDGQLNAVRGDLENPDEQDILIGIEGVKFEDAQGPVRTIAATAGETEIRGLTVTFVGGSGDDRYDVYDAHEVILERINGGNDTVESYVDTYTLDANVENLLLVGPDAVTGIDNEGNNLIVGNLNDSRLFGQGGNDILSVFQGTIHWMAALVMTSCLVATEQIRYLAARAIIGLMGGSVSTKQIGEAHSPILQSPMTLPKMRLR